MAVGERETLPIEIDYSRWLIKPNPEAQELVGDLTDPQVITLDKAQILATYLEKNDGNLSAIDERFIAESTAYTLVKLSMNVRLSAEQIACVENIFTKIQPIFKDLSEELDTDQRAGELGL